VHDDHRLRPPLPARVRFCEGAIEDSRQPIVLDAVEGRRQLARSAGGLDPNAGSSAAGFN